jgi:uncharacterized protein
MPVAADDIQRVISIARRYGASRVLLFGSALAHPESARDLDLAVGGVPGWDFYRMVAEIDDAVSVRTDVIPLEPEQPFVRHILERGRVIYERP